MVGLGFELVTRAQIRQKCEILGIIHVFSKSLVDCSLQDLQFTKVGRKCQVFAFPPYFWGLTSDFQNYQEYHYFSQTVKCMGKNLKETSQLLTTVTKIMFSKLEKTAAFQDFLFRKAISKTTSNQAVCETIGSIMGIRIVNVRNIMLIFFTFTKKLIPTQVQWQNLRRKKGSQRGLLNQNMFFKQLL